MVEVKSTPEAVALLLAAVTVAGMLWLFTSRLLRALGGPLEGMVSWTVLFLSSLMFLVFATYIFLLAYRVVRGE